MHSYARQLFFRRFYALHLPTIATLLAIVSKEGLYEFCVRIFVYVERDTSKTGYAVLFYIEYM